MKSRILDTSIVPQSASGTYIPKCIYCGSSNLRTGAGRKPGQESIHCKDCKKFLGYREVKPLKRFKSEYTQLLILSSFGGAE